MYISNIIKTLLNSKAATFAFFGSMASILSLYGWAGEKFLGYAPETIGIISFVVIGIIALFSVYFLVAAFIYHERVIATQSGYALNHKITHQLRNAISRMQDLEYETSRKIQNVELEAQFSDIVENSELKRREIFKKLGAQVSSAVANQLRHHFASNEIAGNIRVTIKVIKPNGTAPKDWETVTASVDHETWSNQDRILESQDHESHRIGDNSDFEDILIGKRNCFVCNDLQALPEKQYKNSSQEWRKRYNSTIVVPIKSKPDGEKNSVYYGFITADSLNPSKQDQFSSDVKSPTLNIMAHAADAMAVWFVKHDSLSNVLTDRITERRGILAPSVLSISKKEPPSESREIF